MSQRYKGAVISATPPTISSSGADGIWTLQQQLQAQGAGNWPFYTPTYIEDVFSTYLYSGIETNQFITNGLNLGGTIIPTKGLTITNLGGAFDSTYNGTFIQDGIAYTSNSNFTFVASGSGYFDVYVDLGSTQIITSYKIAPQGTVNAASYNNPTAFDVQASNDASTWTTIASFTSISSGYPSWNPGTYRDFSFSNTTAYRYWRLKNTTYGSGGAGVSISEWAVGLSAGTTSNAMVWIKDRSNAYNNALFDTVRGATKQLISNSTNAQTTSATSLTSFNANGFSVGSDNDVNYGSDNMVSWTFKKQSKFFDIVTYTGNSTNRTINHNLGSVPGCMIIKCTSAGSTNWTVWHRGVATPATTYLTLNTTSAETTGNTFYWNSTNPTSTQFSLGTDSNVNNSGQTFVAYLFAHNAGGFGLSGTDNVISCGSFVSTGANQRVDVDLGYQPQWLLVKRSDGTGSQWYLLDSMRGFPAVNVESSNDPTSRTLYANLSNAEGDFSIALRTNGFSMPGGQFSAAGETYIYIAIRRGPMKTPTSGTSVFSPGTYTGTITVANPNNRLSAGADLWINKNRTVADPFQWFPRLSGWQFLDSSSTAAENTSYTWQQTNQTTLKPSADFQANSRSQVAYYMNRAPGFMDVVCFTLPYFSTGSFNHNLGVAPEMMLVKTRNGAGNWYVYHKDLGTNAVLYLAANYAVDTSQNYWSSAPTTTQFSVNNGVLWGSANTAVAYLFASCPGVSKVGSYSGTGGTQTISCGFAARFVMIKRTDSTGNWWVWDTARGMVAGTDPRAAFNSASAETNADWVYTDASGFQIVTTDASVNASGGSYIYLAIA